MASGFTVKRRRGRGHALGRQAASAEVSLANGNVTFRNAAGRRRARAKAAPAGFTPVDRRGQAVSRRAQQFNRGTDEGFYGLGQHQNRQMNYNGEDVELAQHNMDIAVPFVVSTRNYGLLWDNNSITRFGDPEPYPFAGGAGDGLKVTGADGTPGWTAELILGDRPPDRPPHRAGDRLPYLEQPQGLAGRAPRTDERRLDHAGPRSVTWAGPAHARTRAACTASGSTRRATSRSSSTASRCSSAGARTGTPGTTTSTCDDRGQAGRRSASSGSRTAATSRCCHNDPRPDAGPPFAVAGLRSTAARSTITSSPATTWTRSSPAIAR